LKRCPFRWQCPVSSPTTHLNCPLFNFNISFVLLAEGPDISPFACLSPVVGSQCFWPQHGTRGNSFLEQRKINIPAKFLTNISAYIEGLYYISTLIINTFSYWHWLLAFQPNSLRIFLRI
jgi:hypothetical protein